MEGCHLALVGATGLVGQEVLQLLDERDFPLRDLTLLGSHQSEGTRVEFRGRRSVVQRLNKDAFAGVNIAIFVASTEACKDYASHAVQAGAVVIEASGAFYREASVPLCMPELNLAVLQQHHGIVALPHSVTAQVALALAPLHAVAPLKRVVVSTYQAVSGLGRQAVQEFDQQLRDLLNFRPPQVEVLPHQIAFNCLPQCGDFLDNGYTEEEMAFIHEMRRLLAVADLPITTTAVRVPLAYGHSAAVTVETTRPLAVHEARTILAAAPGIVVEDDPKRLQYPYVTQVNGQDDVFVGRIRTDLSVAHGLHLWIVGDNLRRGAALSAVQIAEHLCGSARG